MTDLTPEKREELRTLLDNATPRPWAAATPGSTTETRAQWITSALLAPDAPAAGGLWVAWVPDDHTMGIRIAATTGDGPHAEPDADLIAEAVNALPVLLDAADLLDEVRDQVRRGALCPMCSTGMTRQTVGLICQLCGTDYDKESTR